eukprot:COSAG01_NODE_8675_length_2701_cov_55.451576_4_plen_364_part_00
MSRREGGEGKRALPLTAKNMRPSCVAAGIGWLVGSGTSAVAVHSLFGTENTSALDTVSPTSPMPPKHPRVSLPALDAMPSSLVQCVLGCARPHRPPCTGSTTEGGPAQSKSHARAPYAARASSAHSSAEHSWACTASLSAGSKLARCTGVPMRTARPLNPRGTEGAREGGREGIGHRTYRHRRRPHTHRDTADGAATTLPHAAAPRRPAASTGWGAATDLCAGPSEAEGSSRVVLRRTERHHQRPQAVRPSYYLAGAWLLACWLLLALSQGHRAAAARPLEAGGCGCKQAARHRGACAQLAQDPAVEGAGADRPPPSPPWCGGGAKGKRGCRAARSGEAVCVRSTAVRPVCVGVAALQCAAPP